MGGARKLQGNARSLDVAKNHSAVERNHASLERVVTEMHTKFETTLGKLDSLHTLTRETRSASGSSAEMQAPRQPSPDVLASFRGEISRLANEITELKTAVSPLPALPPMSPAPPQMLPAPPRAADVRETSNQKVLWGCS